MVYSWSYCSLVCLLDLLFSEGRWIWGEGRWGRETGGGAGRGTVAGYNIWEKNKTNKQKARLQDYTSTTNEKIYHKVGP